MHASLTIHVNHQTAKQESTTKFLKKRSNLVITGIALAAIIGGAWYFFQTPQAEATATPELQTTKVRTGDLVISANGAGTVVPLMQADLGFRVSGILKEINVTVGQKVTGGQVLASLEDNLQQAQLAQAEADFQALFSDAGLADAKVTLANAELALQTAVEDYQYLIGPEVYYWEIEVEKANQSLITVKNDAAATEQQKTDAQKLLDRAQANLLAAQQRYRSDYVPELFTYTYIDEESGDEITIVIPPSDTDITLARAKVDSARFAVEDARAALEILQAGPSAVTGPVVAVQGSATAKIEQARLALENARLSVENTRLTAPFDGVVITLDAVVGQTVNTSPLLTLATTQDLQILFYLDETDLDKAAVGNKIIITFDAFPDTTLDGEITSIEQALRIIDGTPVIVAWGSFTNEKDLPVLSGMTVEVEVIGGETHDALLVPVQALRELTPGSYSVFVVQPDGSLQLTPVTVGLRDFANAEILSGLKAGDVVSTGTVETK